MSTCSMLKCVFFIFGAYIFVQLEGAGNEIRKTRYGKVIGERTDLAQVFWGIPYAAPPPRWTDPVDPIRWKGNYYATSPKPMCYQGGSCSDPALIDCIPLKSEDCLYLNIFAPLGTTRSSRKAVFFYIHGGSFEWSSGAAPLFNGEMMANKGDVIVVTINYRLGAFGFLVTGNSSDDITGNFGIKDQRLALKWVYENIRRFGGNKRKITIAGQSAGAYSTAIHFTSGNVDNFFRRAVIQSTPFNIPLKPLNVAEQQGGVFAFLAGCLRITNEAVTTCLRSLTADRVLELQSNVALTGFSDSMVRRFMPWIPHIDGSEVKSGLIEGFLNTTLPKKDLILGTVRDEGFPYIRRGFDEPVNSVAMLYILSLFIGHIPDGLVSLYPITSVSDTREELSAMTTDYIFACPNRLIARKVANQMPVFMYMYDQPLGFPEFLTSMPYCSGRVCHGVDVPFFFQSPRFEPYIFDGEQVAFSDKLMHYLASFVKFGKPSPKRDRVSAPKWLRYKPTGKAKEKAIILKSGEMSHVQGYYDQFCDIWDTTGY